MPNNKEATNKVKYYKNPARKQEPVDRQNYIPQYKVLGITPQAYPSNPLPNNVLIVRGGNTEDDNPRVRKPSIRQPYANVNEMQPIKLDSGQLPNIGNNMEQSWASLDSSDLIEDVGPNDNTPMIDNNDYVDMPQIEKEVQSNNDIISSKENDYILIINGEVISVGSMEQIQELASSLIFGEHPLCNGQEIPIEDIIVLKKINLKLGLFLE